ncbi:hypothetical protein [Erythrobacter rubeus]|uniref:Uncharacterized protein n=1 Tax=Erythrobacter rubeus TaxID=2760803 RepID=A0ABR8KXU4_9SPHN|nr:hypothetical protein [Erythrobacter rubeus]MBD2843041.1 hypothetical protein [Erythrobacter rubeus]
MEFETVAVATRITARISLVLFAFAFVAETIKFGRNHYSLVWGSFVLAHIVHMICVVAYFIVLGEPPELTPALGTLVAGLVALGWIATDLIRKRIASASRMMPTVCSWYLWFLFCMAHVSRLLDPERGSWINVPLLIVAFGSGVVRIVLLRRAPQP